MEGLSEGTLGREDGKEGSSRTVELNENSSSFEVPSPQMQLAPMSTVDSLSKMASLGMSFHSQCHRPR